MASKAWTTHIYSKKFKIISLMNYDKVVLIKNFSFAEK